MPAPAPYAGPTVVRRQLGRRLKQLREAKGVTVQHVVAQPALGISQAKIYKLEAGMHSARPQDVTVLCQFYGATKAETEALTALAIATRGASWWHVYGEDAVPEWFSLYLDVEPAARQIRTYEAELVPGLLQTPDYAREVHRARNPDASDAEIARSVGVRMERQGILTREDPPAPQLHVILNEAVVLRQVGGPTVMSEQLARLRTAAQQPNINIEILPLAAGAHAAMETAFVILDFPDPEEDPPVVYIDSPSSAAYFQKPGELERYETIFSRIREKSVPIEKVQP